MLFGGVSGANPINDAFSYDLQTQEWTRVYRADPAMATPTGELATLHGGTLLKVSSSGGNRFDVVAKLDLGSLAESFTFTGVMKNGVTKQIDALEKFFNTTEGAFGMSEDPDKLEESFDFLLKVMGALYNVKTRKGHRPRAGLRGGDAHRARQAEDQYLGQRQAPGGGTRAVGGHQEDGPRRQGDGEPDPGPARRRD